MDKLTQFAKIRMHSIFRARLMAEAHRIMADIYDEKARTGRLLIDVDDTEMIIDVYNNYMNSVLYKNFEYDANAMKQMLDEHEKNREKEQ